MAPIKHTKTSSTAATPSNPKSSTHVADPKPTPVYADQSDSRLMTLPKEIRNIIYTFVFCDNIDHVHEPIKYEPCDSELKTVMADVPIRVRLDESSPPSKDTILACRELYSEMKEMYAFAYRAYWSNNRFIYDAGQRQARSVLPAGADLQHIQQFCLLLDCLKDYYLHVVFEGGHWKSWLLPVDGNILQSHGLRTWLEGQLTLKRAVASRLAITGASLDPRMGRGLTRTMLRGISNNKGVARGSRKFTYWEQSRIRFLQLRQSASLLRSLAEELSG